MGYLGTKPPVSAIGGVKRDLDYDKIDQEHRKLLQVGLNIPRVSVSIAKVIHCVLNETVILISIITIIFRLFEIFNLIRRATATRPSLSAHRSLGFWIEITLKIRLVYVSLTMLFDST